MLHAGSLRHGAWQHRINGDKLTSHFAGSRSLVGAGEAILSLRRGMDDHLPVLPAGYHVAITFLRGVDRATDAVATKQIGRAHHDGAPALVLDAQVDIGVGGDA